MARGKTPPTEGPSLQIDPGAGTTFGAQVEGGTGRYLVLMESNGVQDGMRALTNHAGIQLQALSGSEAAAAEGSLPEGEGVVLPDLGVAVVNSAPERAADVGAAVAGASSLLSYEEERWIYAAPVDLQYLRGFRDAVVYLVDQVIGAGGGSPSSEGVADVDTSALSWGLQAINIGSARTTGRGIKVAVLDTGIDLTHPDFTGRAITSQTFVGGQSAQDGHGHGTHCAGIVTGPLQPSRLPRYGVAPDISLYVGKVLGDAGRGTDASILAGIQWALQNGCDIVSMSLGSPADPNQSYSPIYEQVAQRALDRNCLLICAAGNDSRRPQVVKPVGHPANCPSILAVAAVDRALQVAWFSNAGLNPVGGQVDLSGPGVDVVSAWLTPLLYKAESGTSMATPHVAGVAALLAEANPGSRGRALAQLLSQGARRLSASGIDVGAGLVQC